MSSCPFCKSESTRNSFLPHNIYNKKVFQYSKCGECGLIYIAPFPNDSDFAKMYSVGYHEIHYFKTIPNFTRNIELINKYKSGNELVDYGCGDASFVNAFQESGFTCSGVEYNEDHISKLRNNNNKVQFLSIDSFQKNTNTYDVISIRDVVEHVTNPNELLSLFQSKLNSGGILYVEGPLENNFTVSLITIRLVYLLKYILGKKTEHPPYHLIFANKRNQLRLFQESGFVTEYYKVYESEWPYPASINQVGGVGSLIKYVIGKISKSLALLFPSTGNRFIYIGRKK